MGKASEAKYLLGLAAMDVEQSLSADRPYALEVFYRRVREYDIEHDKEEKRRLIKMIRVTGILAAFVIGIVTIGSYIGG